MICSGRFIVINSYFEEELDDYWAKSPEDKFEKEQI